MKQLRRIGLLGVYALLPVFAACDQEGITGVERDSGASLALSSTTSSEPELPRVYLNTRYIAPTGKTINVAAGGNLQTAINNAQPGDQIVLQAGASFTGNFTLPNKTGTGWIVIRSSGTLPPEGTRIMPAQRSALARVVSPNSGSAIKTAPGAHHYRLVGLEITYAGTVSSGSALVALGSGSTTQTSASTPNNLIIDRSYIHGHSGVDFQRCVALNSASTAIIDSYLSQCHSRLYDSQAIVGWNGPGPFKIVNNRLEGAGENVMFGGALPATGVVPSDIEIRRNHFVKPLSWKDVWLVKNLFEIKQAQRVLLGGNVFENSWKDGQGGMAMIIKRSTYEGRCTWCVSQDITIRNNIIRNTGGGITITETKRIRINNNQLDKLTQPGSGRMFVVLRGIADLKMEHNTGFAPGHMVLADGGSQPGFVFRNNLMSRGSYGFYGSGKGEGKLALDYYMPGYVFAGNVIIAATASRYPTGNFFPAGTSNVGFVDYARGNYRLASSSPYKGKATDGRDPGANIDALESATAGVVK